MRSSQLSEAVVNAACPSNIYYKLLLKAGKDGKDYWCVRSVEHCRLAGPLRSPTEGNVFRPASSLASSPPTRRTPDSRFKNFQYQDPSGTLMMLPSDIVLIQARETP